MPPCPRPRCIRRAPDVVNARRFAAALLLALLPLAAAEGLARMRLGGSLARSLPYVSDEVAYWSQVATFAAAGFDGGYATIDERPARAAFTHFGPNGPVFSMMYGAPARLTGWGYRTAPIYGAIAWVVAAVIWVLAARPAPLQAALLLATFWPVVLAAPNTMQEPLHLAVGCVLAALLPTLVGFAPAHRVWWRWLAAALAVSIVASLVRPVWGIAAIGAGWQMARSRGARWGGWGLVAGAALCAVAYVSFSALASPYPSAVGGLGLLTGNPSGSAVLLARAVRDGAAVWLTGDAEPLERAFRFEVLAVTALCAWSAWRDSDAAARRIAAAMSLTLALVIVGNLALRNTGSWQDYRTATPVLLMAVLTASAARFRWTWAVVAANLALAPVAVATFDDFHAERFATDREPRIAQFAAAVDGVIRFDPALGGWGNTVLVSVDRYDTPLMGLPRGIAVSAVFDWTDVALPVRSRYLLLTDAEVQRLTPRVPLRKLRDTPLGELYENTGWARGRP